MFPKILALLICRKDDVRQILDLHCLSVENGLIVIERDS